MLGATLPTPLYGIYAERLGFGTLVQTTLFASYAVGVLGALIGLGQLSDRVGRRPLLLLGLLAGAASAVCFVVADGLLGLFAGRLLSGVSAGIFTGTATTALVELAPDRWKGRATFLATAANVLGLGLGPAFAGLLSDVGVAPLRLPYLGHLVLLVPAAVATWWQPETVRDRRSWRIQVLRPTVPEQVRASFLPAAVAGFAGFITFGLFTAVSPNLLHAELGVPGRATAGALVGVPFLASVVGQAASQKVSQRRALPLGCAGLALGAAALVLALATSSLAVFVVAAVLLGLGHGTAFRAGVAAVRSDAPDDRTGEVVSTLFVVLYVGISLPVVVLGALAVALGLVHAAEALSVVVALLAVTALLILRRRPLPA